MTTVYAREPLFEPSSCYWNCHVILFLCVKTCLNSLFRTLFTEVLGKLVHKHLKTALSHRPDSSWLNTKFGDNWKLWLHNVIEHQINIKV